MAIAFVLALAAIAMSSTPVNAAPSGPELQTPADVLASALVCPTKLKTGKPSVLLVHGTTATGTDSWPKGLGKVLSNNGFDWCMLNIPDREVGDIQSNAEFVVHAVRSMNQATRAKVSIVGHSQGGPLSRWALQWWPDVRAAVDDHIGIEGVYKPTEASLAMCAAGRCVPALWQLHSGSQFWRAAGRDPMPGDVSYTAIGSTTDFTIDALGKQNYFIPGNPGNVLVQNKCPGRFVDHVQALFDSVVLAIVLDALQHRGTADLGRVDPAVCGQSLAAGVKNSDVLAAIPSIYFEGLPVVFNPNDPSAVPNEPPLRPYARAGTR